MGCGAKTIPLIIYNVNSRSIWVIGINEGTAPRYAPVATPGGVAEGVVMPAKRIRDETRRTHPTNLKFQFGFKTTCLHFVRLYGDDAVGSSVAP